jgi:ABC-type transport system involved in multi-copper enzyme maturation permease subunit
MRQASAPSPAHVVTVIARRELRIALQRKIVKLLFLASFVPVLVFATIIAVRVLGADMGRDLGWDPISQFLQVQLFPILLLVLGLGVPLVASDRSEEVLFLYATRPVLPWTYMAGKMLAVAGPAAGLLFVPGSLIALLRFGMLQDVGLVATGTLIGKIGLASACIGLGLAGVTVGASAAVRRERAGLILALLLLYGMEIVHAAVLRGAGPALGPMEAGRELIQWLFDPATAPALGWVGAPVLLAYAAAAAFGVAWRVSKEMVP